MILSEKGASTVVPYMYTGHTKTVSSCVRLVALDRLSPIALYFWGDGRVPQVTEIHADDISPWVIPQPFGNGFINTSPRRYKILKLK